MSFRDNLLHLRAANNITQEQLAMLLGVSGQAVTKWESEKSYLEMDKLLKMCQVFNCTLDELVQGDLTSREPALASEKRPATPPIDVSLLFLDSPYSNRVLNLVQLFVLLHSR